MIYNEKNDLFVINVLKEVNIDDIKWWNKILLKDRKM